MAFAAIGLLLAGALATVAVLAAAGFSRRPDYGSLASGGGASCTLTGATTAPGGTVTVCVRYAVSGTGQVHIRSVRAAYNSANGYALPRFTVTLANGATGEVDQRLPGALGQGDQFQSYSSRFAGFRGPGADGFFALGETMVVTLDAWEGGANGPYNLPLATVALVLNRPAFPCPAPGTSAPSGTRSC